MAQKRDQGRITIRDVANEAAVSLGTVSRVLNGNRSVSEEIRARVLETIKRLGYQPDAVAQSLRTQATRAIGIMVSEVANPLFSRIVGGAEPVLSAASYITVLANSRDQVERELELLELFKRRRLDGLITTVSREDDPRLIEAYRAFPIPLVLLERELVVPTDSVATDHEGGIRQACRYLFMLGHRRIALITVPTAALPGRQRAQGFAAAHQAMGLSLDPAMVSTEGFSSEYGFRSAHNLLTLRNPPTAIAAGGNQIPGVLRAAHMLGRKIPEELSVITLGDTELAALVMPPLTAVRWEVEEVGRTAAQLMLSRLQGSAAEAPRRIVLPTELILRQSCAPPKGARPAGKGRRGRS